MLQKPFHLFQQVRAYTGVRGSIVDLEILDGSAYHTHRIEDHKAVEVIHAYLSFPDGVLEPFGLLL